MKVILDILKFIWQLPQNIAGLIYYLYLQKKGKILMVDEYNDIPVFTKASSGSITLGEYIFLSPRAAKKTINHEYGHTRQSLILGPLYLIVIGLPSLIWSYCRKTIAPDKKFEWFYTEAWADKLGKVK